MSAPRRWPQWIYREGNEPDVRFSLANERTLLA
jgi:putative membrane protein